MDKPQARKALQRAHQSVLNAQRALEAAKTAEIAAVAAAREAGATWDEVGEDVGMARPNAFRKFNPHLEQTTTRTVRVRPDQT